MQGIFGENSRTRVQDVRDGLSNVIFSAERRMPQECNLDFASNPVQGSLCGVWAGVPAPDGMSKIGALLFTASTGDATQLNSTGDLLGAPVPGGLHKAGGISPAVIGVNRLATELNGSRTFSGDNQIYNSIGASSWHSGGVQVLLGDGTVRFITENVYEPIWLNLCRKADGQDLGQF